MRPFRLFLGSSHVISLPGRRYVLLSHLFPTAALRLLNGVVFADAVESPAQVGRVPGSHAPNCLQQFPHARTQQASVLDGGEQRWLCGSYNGKNQNKLSTVCELSHIGIGSSFPLICK
ncbi:hypothetical protein BS47DRAFT_328660 [Hydnum rufescens UP504]|uniref:Uncharacterized protein n=1 Tax=Hydnum rufescens UP504 TaxID=1448309 RepID=A0A9P6E0T1_9AGAM|nr:hypothetical protein BS47DRAFT_328660 [Hydnum rufescens UP504]